MGFIEQYSHHGFRHDSSPKKRAFAMGHEFLNDDGHGYRLPPYQYDPYSSASAHAFFRYDAPPRPRAHAPTVNGHITASEFQAMMDGADHDSIVRDEAILLWTQLAIRMLVLRGDIDAISEPSSILAMANELRRHRGLPPLPS
jgi:hypothetical protein